MYRADCGEKPYCRATNNGKREGAFFDGSLHGKHKDKCVDIEEIDPCMLPELIKAIYVEAPDKSSSKRGQKIHIQYDDIGFIPLEELAKKGRRDRSHAVP